MENKLFSLRIAKLTSALKNKGIDGILISSESDITYLTGEQGIEGYLFVSIDNNPILFTDFRYYLQAKQIPQISLRIYSSGIFDYIAKNIKRTGAKNICLQARSLPLAEYNIFKEKFTEYKISLNVSEDPLPNIRAVKDKTEIAKIKKAVEITLEAFKFARDILYPGISEKRLSIEIERFLKLKGDNAIAFNIITAAGKNSALPHYSPQEAKIVSNKPLLIDMGAKYQGYCADLTRVLFSDKMPSIFAKIFNVVKTARVKAIEKIKPGVRIKDIDLTARNYIEKCGYGKYFGHSLGHGVGLNVHEKPFINKNNDSIILENMVFTVEPGIYIPSKFGIRYESVIRVTAKGCEVLDAD